jgi:methyl-accepting chemotaxis protein
MKKNGLSHIRKWLFLYLTAVLLTTMVFYFTIFVEVTSAISTLGYGAEGPTAARGQSVGVTLGSLKLRLLLILTGGFIICGLSGIVWVGCCTRQLGKPVRTIARAMSKLTRGQLNETVTVKTSDEFEEIGASINELAANLQELLLYIWKQTGQCHTLLDHIQCHPDLCHHKQPTLESLVYLKQLSEAIDDLRDMAKAYVFYDVRIEGTRTHAINDPGNLTPMNSLTEIQ